MMTFWKLVLRKLENQSFEAGADEAKNDYYRKCGGRNFLSVKIQFVYIISFLCYKYQLVAQVFAIYTLNTSISLFYTGYHVATLATLLNM